MPRWLRVIRGMIGTGVTFAAGVGAVGLVLGLIGMLLGKIAVDDLRFVARLSVVAFLVGVGFSGVLALSARGRTFDRLSLRFVTALGAGGGLLFFLFLAANGGRAWSLSNAVSNFVTLIVLGGGSAATTLLVARRAGNVLKSGEAARRIEEGGLEPPEH